MIRECCVGSCGIDKKRKKESDRKNNLRDANAKKKETGLSFLNVYLWTKYLRLPPPVVTKSLQCEKEKKKMREIGSFKGITLRKMTASKEKENIIYESISTFVRT